MPFFGTGQPGSGSSCSLKGKTVLNIFTFAFIIGLSIVVLTVCATRQQCSSVAFGNIQSQPQMFFNVLYRARLDHRHAFGRLPLILAGCSRILVLAGKDHRSPMDLRKRFGGDGRAICSDGGTDGHEEAKCCCRPEHVLAEGAQHSIWTWPEAHDIGKAKYESNNEADRAAHHATHLEFVQGRGSMFALGHGTDGDRHDVLFPSLY